MGFQVVAVSIHLFLFFFFSSSHRSLLEENDEYDCFETDLDVENVTITEKL